MSAYEAGATIIDILIFDFGLTEQEAQQFLNDFEEGSENK